ncbi:hypothetical protein ABH940_003418 [Streptacidiphilus sp. BW17]|jgi:hypothetical protein|uniref:lanthionine synthetase C family protein n=1 Tax=Streptacidiphilus sp. BW17 TaxID=3156274 RepID=UPI003511A80C
MTTLTDQRPAAPWLAQDLGNGAIGSALLAIERAHLSLAPWDDAHRVLRACTHELVVDDRASLFYGAPAVAFVLHTASLGSTRYARALDQLDAEIGAVVRHRLELAHRRIDSDRNARVSEFDLLYGLTGLGVLLLERGTDPEGLHAILAYLVRLTLPHAGGLPGWWTDLDPSGRSSEAFTGGHGNAGIAHGICGPLGLLALAALRGFTVEGHREAINRILVWLHSLRCTSAQNTWWPEWITLQGHRTDALPRTLPTRPSWCYGLPGQVRAQQLAAMALGDTTRKQAVEAALLTGLSNPSQLAQLRESGLCHGLAGVLLTVHRVAADAAQPEGFRPLLSALRAGMSEAPAGRPDGFLQGPDGAALVRLVHQQRGDTRSGWDACLLASPWSPR